MIKIFRGDVKYMKMVRMLSMILLCLLMTACSNAFAKREYHSDEKISQTSDRYAKEVSVGNSTNRQYSLTVGKFNGRETLWEEKLEENQDVEIDISFSLSNGRGKIVHIDKDDNVTTVIECTPDTSTDGFVTKTLSLTSGQNRLKLVGYDCENIDLKIQAH